MQQPTLFDLPPPTDAPRRRVSRPVRDFDEQVEIDMERLANGQRWNTPPIVDIYAMPKTRAECIGPGICPKIGCRHNLSLRVKDSGAIKVDGGGPGTTMRLERRGRKSINRRAERMADAIVERAMATGTNCALDYADRGPMSIAQVSAAIGVTQEIVRLVTNEGIHAIDIAEAKARRQEDREQEAAAKLVLYQIRRRK